MQHPAAFYAQQIEKYAAEQVRTRRRLMLISLTRIGCFVGVAYSCYYTIISDSNLFLYLFLLLTAAFILLLRLFSGLRTRATMAAKMVYINENEASVCQKVENRFPHGFEPGKPSLFALDLDIFGKGSLYHFLNRTTTTHGSTALGEMLNAPYRDPAQILTQQQAIKQLCTQPEKCQLITARGLSIDTSNVRIEEMWRWFKMEAQVYKKRWINIFRFLMPLVNIGSFLYYLDSNNPIPAGLCLFITWLIIGRFSPYIQQQHSAIGRKQAVLDQYASILKEYISIDGGNSAQLAKLARIAEAGNQSIYKLSKLSSAFDQRLNLLVAFILNSVLLYDIHVILALEKWKDKHQQDFSGWINAVGEIEMLLSLAAYTFREPGYCFPVVSKGRPQISAKAMSHPLIAPDESVSNDIAAGQHEKLLLVTGSNMSGKSTFLRTVGVNVLLAQCGAPVCASSFECTVMKILSSIRISDSLQDHTSYFMAELKKLHAIISELSDGEAALVLVDEVLRGTNSNDKSYGSEALIHKLVQQNTLVLFATHDLSLSALEQPGSLITNYCFESSIENGELIFDYKLHRGVAANRNATFLMKKMGII